MLVLSDVNCCNVAVVARVCVLFVVAIDLFCCRVVAGGVAV